MSDFDRSAVERLLNGALSRLAADEHALNDGGLDDEEAHLRAFAAFEHALAAAGYARALGDDERVRELLDRAAKAAVRLFELRGALSSEVGDLATGASDVFVDTSATNPWTFVQAAYAAVISGNGTAREELARLEPRDFSSDQVTVVPALELYATALAHVLGGRLDVAQEELAQERSGGDTDEQFWTAQIGALRQIVAGDAGAFRDAMGAVVRAFEATYAGEERRGDPERLLALPILGLEALAQEQPGP
jgi:Immunity protein 49